MLENNYINNFNNIQHKHNILNNTCNIDNNINNIQLSNTILKSNYDINNYLGMFSNFQTYDEDNDNNHKQTLNEFKKLLRKIDQRLEAPLIENRPGNIQIYKSELEQFKY